MIGQTRLINTINELSSLPHSMLLIGERGSEQEEVCSYIADKFNLLEFDMTDIISDEFISQIYESHSPTLYSINVSDISEREQNILLKLFEEPSQYSYIILLAEADNQVLDTIRSRSILFRSDKYDKETLRKFIVDRDEELVLSVCSTPGQIELANHTDINSLYSLCNSMYDTLERANYGNALKIANKINFKDSYEKFDLYLYIKMMRYVLFKRGNKHMLYEHLVSMSNYIFSMNDKKLAFENYITKIWKSSRLV